MPVCRLNELVNGGVIQDENGARQRIEAVLQVAVQRQYTSESPLRVKFSGEGTATFSIYVNISIRQSSNDQLAKRYFMSSHVDRLVARKMTPAVGVP